MALITFPLLARNLTVSEFGNLDLGLAVIGFLSTVLIFGQDSSVARFFYDDEAFQSRQHTISMSLIFQCLLVAALLPLLWLALNPFVSFRHLGENHQEMLVVILLQVPFYLIINFSKNILKWSFERKKFLILTLGFSIVHGSLIVILTLSEPINPLKLLILGLFSSLFFAVIGVFFVRGWLILPKSWDSFKPMLRYAWPLGIVCVLAALSPIVERLLVTEVFGPDALGLYAVAIKICVIFSMLHAAFQTAWGPFSLSLFKEENADLTFNQVARLVSYVSCFLVLIISLIAEPIIIILAGEQYRHAAVLVAPISFGLILTSVAMVLEVGIGIAKKPVYSMVAYVAGMTVMLASVKILISIFGILGVPISVFLGVLVKMLISINCAQRVYPMAWKYRYVFESVVLSVIAWAVSLWLKHYDFEMAANALLILVVIFFGIEILRNLKKILAGPSEISPELIG